MFLSTTDHDPARLAGVAAILVVLLLVVLEFFGVGTISDARLQAIMTGVATMLGAIQAGRAANEYLQKTGTGSNNRTDSQSRQSDTDTPPESNGSKK